MEPCEPRRLSRLQQPVAVGDAEWYTSRAVHWFLLASEEVEGPAVGQLPIEPSTRKGLPGSRRTHFSSKIKRRIGTSLRTHAGSAGADNSISGHIFSRDLGGPWIVSPVEPYANTVRYADGTVQMFSLRSDRSCCLMATAHQRISLTA